jgi:hypothetical protein
MPRFSPMLAAAAMSIALAATGPAGALPLHPSPAVAQADGAQANVQTVDHRSRRHNRHRGGVYFNFGLGSPFFGSPYIYQPRVYSYDPYSYRYYEPYYAPRTYVPAPAPYVYAPAPYASDSTGRCDAGQVYRHPVGCVPG